jgi:hypothetical protein
MFGRGPAWFAVIRSRASSRSTGNAKRPAVGWIALCAFRKGGSRDCSRVTPSYSQNPCPSAPMTLLSKPSVCFLQRGGSYRPAVAF